MDVFRFTKDELEDILDQAKATVLLDLVYDNLLAIDIAEDYSMKNTVILKKKNFFRTITDKWKKYPEEGSYYMVMVGNDHISSTAETQQPNKGGGILTSMLHKVLRENIDPTVSGVQDNDDLPEPAPNCTEGN